MAANRRPGYGFEVQFHTKASFEAKELSHKAYERIRSIEDPGLETDREAAELEGFQSSVNAMIPIPPDMNISPRSIDGRSVMAEGGYVTMRSSTSSAAGPSLSA